MLSTPQICEALPLHTSYLAAALVARGTLGPRALQAARNLLLNGSLAGEPGEEGAVAAFLGRAAAALPAAAQQQWVLDVLDAAKVHSVCGCGGWGRGRDGCCAWSGMGLQRCARPCCCAPATPARECVPSHLAARLAIPQASVHPPRCLRTRLQACASPGGALQLACCVLACAATASAAARQEPELALNHLTAVSCAASTTTLSHSLGALAKLAGWRAGVIAALQRLAAAVGAAGATQQGAAWGGVLVAALLAARHLLPQELWGTLAARLA